MDFTRFEKLYDTLPYKETDRHPDGLLVAMHAYAKIPRTAGPDAQTIRSAVTHVLQKMKRPITPQNLALFGVKDGPLTDTFLRSAVWHLQSGALIWAPNNTIALAWLGGGHEVALLRERCDPDPERHPVLGSPLQTEFTYTWERRTWPGKELIHSCQICMPTGWPTALAISPCSDLAAFQWKDQGESGLEFIAISQRGDHQIMHTELPILENVTDLCFRPEGNGFPIGSNLTSPPTFSPDGRFIIFACQNGWDWWTGQGRMPNTASTADLFLKTSACQIGAIEIINWKHRHVREIAITPLVNADTYTTKSSKEIEDNLVSSPPTFIDNEHFMLHLPTGEIQTYTVHEQGPTTRLI